MTTLNIIPINLPNVSGEKALQEYAKDRSANVSEYTFSGAQYDIHPMVEKLALKHPEWRFEAFRVHLSDPNNCLFATGFEVSFNREKLGRFWVQRNYGASGGSTFCITNQRIRENLQRGDSLKTAKLDTAIKKVEKNFSPLNETEFFEQRSMIGLDGIGDIRSAIGRDIRYAWENALHIHKFIRSKWDEFLSTLDVQIKSEMEVIPEKEALLAKMVRLTTAPAYIIVIKDSKYLVKKDDVLSIWDADALPEIVRRKLGILKLVKDGTFIEGSGYRQDEFMFLISGDEE
jgi:hypothetical protein